MKNMQYKCVDVGTEKCPCHLAKAQQCYTCTMLTEGICRCGQNWRGVCPFTEYSQNNSSPKNLPDEKNFKVIERKKFSDQLWVIRLDVPTGFAQKCRTFGSYILVKVNEFWVPLSILKSEYTAGNHYIELAIQPVGPKTKDIIDINAKTWKVKGPFLGGLVGIDDVDLFDGTPLLIIAKGTALAPVINLKSSLKIEQPGIVTVFIDGDKLTDTFLNEYMGDVHYQKISLFNDFSIALDLVCMYERVMFLASPYYTKKLMEAKSTKRNHKKHVITSNHANICCGVGMCGSCSFTDENGNTIRKCKCNLSQ